jgi:hypothetical protein
MGRSGKGKSESSVPLFAQHYVVDVIDVALLEVELSWDYNGRLQARVIDEETGEITLLTTFGVGLGARDRHAVMLNGIAVNYMIDNKELADILGIEKNGSEYVDAIRRGYVAINSRDFRERINLLNEIFCSIKTYVDGANISEYIRDASNGESILQRLCSGNRAVFFEIKRELFRRTGGSWS